MRQRVFKDAHPRAQHRAIDGAAAGYRKIDGHHQRQVEQRPLTHHPGQPRLQHQRHQRHQCTHNQRVAVDFDVAAKVRTEQGHAYCVLPAPALPASGSVEGEAGPDFGVVAFGAAFQVRDCGCLACMARPAMRFRLRQPSPARSDQCAASGNNFGVGITGRRNLSIRSRCRLPGATAFGGNPVIDGPFPFRKSSRSLRGSRSTAIICRGLYLRRCYRSAEPRCPSSSSLVAMSCLS